MTTSCSLISLSSFSMAHSRSTYAIYGWMVGDALGVTLEFMSKADAKAAIKAHNYFLDGLPGGGSFGFQPGQFSDDTEMGLAMWDALRRYGTYNVDAVADAYHKWYKSNPKDIGKATSNAVSNATAMSQMRAAEKLNSGSLSNGFLMRIPPLIVFYQGRPWPELLDALKQDLIERGSEGFY